MTDLQFNLKQTALKFAQEDLANWEKTNKEVRQIKLSTILSLEKEITDYLDQELQSRSIQDETSMSGEPE